MNSLNRTQTALECRLPSACPRQILPNFSLPPPNLHVLPPSRSFCAMDLCPHICFISNDQNPILELRSYTYASHSTKYQRRVCCTQKKYIRSRAGVGDWLLWTVLKVNTHLLLLIRYNFILRRKQKLEEDRNQEGLRTSKDTF